MELFVAKDVPDGMTDVQQVTYLLNRLNVVTGIAMIDQIVGERDSEMTVSNLLHTVIGLSLVMRGIKVPTDEQVTQIAVPVVELINKLSLESAERIAASV